MREGEEEKLMLDLEDKGDLKMTLKKAGIEPEHITEVYHISYCLKMELPGGKDCRFRNVFHPRCITMKYDREKFMESMKEICKDESKTSFIIKPTHLSWSAGLKIVSKKEEKCKQEDLFKKVCSGR